MSSRRVNGTSRGFHNDTAAMGAFQSFDGRGNKEQQVIERKRARPTTVSVFVDSWRDGSDVVLGGW
jgi:hypothetical protein